MQMERNFRGFGQNITWSKDGMNREIKMSISSMTRSGDKKAVYVLFTDKDLSAEFTIPGCQLLSSHGFAEEDLRQLKEYIENEQDYLFSLAKEINPIRSFLGDRKEEKVDKSKRIIVDEG